jgi:arsenite oxidase small subunit
MSERDEAAADAATYDTAVDGAAVDHRRRSLLAWVWRLPVLAAVGGGAYGLVSAYRIHFAKIPPAADPVFIDRPPRLLAPLDAFTAPWDAVEFVLSGLPALAVRLADPIPGGMSHDGVHVAAFSRVCTHRACLLDLTREPEAIAFAFNHRTDRPQLTCACHYSVFDPVRAGRAVSGPAVEPLPRVRLRVADEPDGPWVIADGVETRG